MSGTLGQGNGFRYRGYFWDGEIGFYYLNSRFYDPAVKRFINADGQLNTSMLGYNLYAYCENEPVRRSDPTGRFHYAADGTPIINSASDYFEWQEDQRKKASLNEKGYYNKVGEPDNKGKRIVTTTIRTKNGDVTYTYEIDKKGIVTIDLSQNSITVADVPTLAEAIWDAAKSVNKNYMKGRTIKGIIAEIIGHANLGGLSKRIREADIGGTDVDHNAWVWELLAYPF